MTLEQVYFVSKILSAIAVVASLLFVGVQLRLNTHQMRVAASQTYSNAYHQAVSSIVDNGETAHIWRLGLANFGDLSDDERVRFMALTSEIFRMHEASRAQWLRGQLEDEHWHIIEQQALSFAMSPGIKDWWALRRHWHLPEFQRWFESLPSTSTTLYGQFRAAGTPEES